MKETQLKIVLQHMREYGSITSKEASDAYGIMNLPGRIYDLKREGYSFRVKWETSKNRFGKLTSYARYYLEDGDAVQIPD